MLKTRKKDIDIKEQPFNEKKVVLKRLDHFI